MKRLSKFQILSLVLLSLLTIAFAVLWVRRSALPYNSEGRYFDETNMIVYEEQAQLSFALLTVLMFGLLVAMVAWSVKTVRK